MATIIVESGNGDVSSNSYTSIAEFNDYVSERGYTLSLTNGDVSQLLLNAMLYLETLEFIGRKKSSNQSLLWPRIGVYIDGFYVGEIPKELRVAQIEIALGLDSGVDLLAPLTQKVKREKIGPIDITYDDVSNANTSLPKVDMLLRKLLSSTRNYKVIRV